MACRAAAHVDPAAAFFGLRSPLADLKNITFQSLRASREGLQNQAREISENQSYGVPSLLRDSDSGD
jgi:hypothetical protein